VQTSAITHPTVNEWALVQQGIHNLPRTHKQIFYDLPQKTLSKKSTIQAEVFEQKLYSAEISD
jgi:hypothetical protein